MMTGLSKNISPHPAASLGRPFLGVQTRLVAQSLAQPALHPQKSFISHTDSKRYDTQGGKGWGYLEMYLEPCSLAGAGAHGLTSPQHNDAESLCLRNRS